MQPGSDDPEESVSERMLNAKKSDLYVDTTTGEIKIETSARDNEEFSSVVHQKLSDLSWSITKIEIYTLNGLPIFSANYSSAIAEFNSSVVMQFYQTVQRFAENSLGTQMADFQVGDERIIFSVSEDHIYIVATRLGSKAKSGFSSEMYVSISALITDISSLLFFQNSAQRINPSMSLNEMIAEMVEDVNHNINLVEEDDPKIDQLNIGYAVITDNTGIPILSQTYESSSFNDDPMLLTMFLHALNVFFNTNFSDNLNEINFGNSRLYIKNYESHFYAIMVQFEEAINLREDSQVHQLCFEILDRMQEMVADLAEDIELISDDNLELMVDNFIFKAQFQLNENIAQ